MAVAACKLPGIRAAVGHDTYTAAQCVEHDDCNVLCLGARVVGPAMAAKCVRRSPARSSAVKSATCADLRRSNQIEKEH